MPKVQVLNMKGDKVGEIELSDAVFAAPINTAVMHQVVTAQLANKRQGTQSALTRAEVSGGGRKPWRQKGTGRARQGSTRSPQWKHGGVVFAPKPRDYRQSIPRKMRRLALKSALSSKVETGSLIVLDDLSIEGGKTKRMAEVIKSLGCKKALVCVKEGAQNEVRSMRNIPGVQAASVHTLNVYDILRYDSFVVTKAMVQEIEEVYAR